MPCHTFLGEAEHSTRSIVKTEPVPNLQSYAVKEMNYSAEGTHLTCSNYLGLHS
jgi:hypothetical protein